MVRVLSLILGIISLLLAVKRCRRKVVLVLAVILFAVTLYDTVPTIIYGCQLLGQGLESGFPLKGYPVSFDLWGQSVWSVFRYRHGAHFLYPRWSCVAVLVMNVLSVLLHLVKRRDRIVGAE